MGCKCKEQAKKAEKYADEETTEEQRGVQLAANFISKFFIVILLTTLLIICTPFLACYAVYCVVAGHGINISKFLKRINGKKQ